MHGLSPPPFRRPLNPLLRQAGPDLPTCLGPKVAPRDFAAGFPLDQLPRLDGDWPVALGHLREVAGADAHLLGEPSGASAFVGKPSLEVHGAEYSCICYRSQAAFATGAVAIVPRMETDRQQEQRRARLRELRDAKFEGMNSALGRALGHAGGAFVRQLLDGERPITEKTIAKVESLRGCAGWFATASPSTAPGIADASEPDTATIATAGQLLLAVAISLEGVDTFKRKAIASIVSDMLVSGERESAASAIDAVATVVVSVPGILGDMRSKSSPIRANHDDQNHNLVETGGSKSNESITVPPAPSQVMGTPPGADKETGKPWKELGTLVGGTGPDRRQSKEWTTPGKPKSGRRRKT